MPTQTFSLLPQPPRKGCQLPTCTNNTSNPTTLERCSSCKSVAYCSNEHQLADWAAHKPLCDKLKALLRTLERERRKLLASTDFLGAPNADVFENPAKVGYFWSLLETRDYMRARYEVFFVLAKESEALLGLEAAAKHGWEMLRLCRSDNLGVRDVLPGVLLRIGEDQKALGFCWYWVRSFHDDDDEDNEEGDEESDEEEIEPYLRPEHLNRSIFTALPEKWVSSRFTVLPQMIPIALLKLRAYLDLGAFLRHFGFDPDADSAANSDACSVTLNDVCALDQQALQSIAEKYKRPFGISSCILHRDANANDANASLTSLRARLSSQIDPLLKHIHKANKHFLSAILSVPQSSSTSSGTRNSTSKLAKYLKAQPVFFSDGTAEQAQLLVQYHWKTWVGDEGVMAEVRRRGASLGLRF
ncbi:hypothetical protein CVT26_011684 [Gymnopilus dilepis]|uniref:MYND-type domain-containing protein n=1 Tax=Gymnopilus dilepis TaxID=231916 RepID=A0A409W8X4_9AGAR|nr:hypothetical protein CVT26_011684 [Gymnopilus dilepis]